MTDGGTPTAANADPGVPTIAVVDVGNTAAKVLVSGDHNTQPKRFRLSHSDWPQRVIEWANQDAPVASWRIASVNRSAGDELRAAIESDCSDGQSTRVPAPHVQSIVHTDIPMEVAVHHPERVGIDRLLGAYAASQHHTPAVIVDAGSAVTVDYVDVDRIYRGGAILPGLTMQASSLASGTDLLPQIDWSDATDIETPGRDTVAAIRLGIITNITAAVDRLVDRYASQSPRQPTVVVTGGDSAVIRANLETASRHEPGLVCEAMLRL